MRLASVTTKCLLCPFTTDRGLFPKYAKSVLSTAPKTCTHLVQLSSLKLQSTLDQNRVTKWANPSFFERRIGLTVKQLIETQASQSSAKASSFVYVFKYARCSLVVVEHMGTKNRITINIHVPFSIYGNHSAWQCLRHVYCAWKLCQQRWPSGHGTDFDHSHHLCSRKFAYWVHSLFYPHKTNQLLKNCWDRTHELKQNRVQAARVQ